MEFYTMPINASREGTVAGTPTPVKRAYSRLNISTSDHYINTSKYVYR